MSIVYRVNLNMDSGTIPTAIHVGQYDDDFSIVFTPYSTNGVFTIEEDTTAEIRGTKRDGNGYSAAATIDSTVTPKTVTVEGATQMTAIAGKNPFEIVFEKNGKVVSSANFNLVVEHAAMDAETVESESVIKEIGESVNAWLDEHGAGAGLTDGIKTALLQIAEKVAYIDEDGQDYYDDLYAALYPPANLVSITAVYTQSGTVYDTDSLDILKSDLLVTAAWSNGSTTTLASNDYSLSGTLAEGTSTITVSYCGQTATFNVTVTHYDNSVLNWDFTQSLVDTKQNRTAELAESGITQSSAGLTWTDTANVFLGTNNLTIYTVEIDVTHIQAPASGNMFFLSPQNSLTGSAQGGLGFVVGSIWKFRDVNGGWHDISGGTGADSATVFDGKTMKIHIDRDISKTYSLYSDDVLVGSVSFDTAFTARTGLAISGRSGTVITGLRIYEGLV